MLVHKKARLLQKFTHICLTISAAEQERLYVNRVVPHTALSMLVQVWATGVLVG